MHNRQFTLLIILLYAMASMVLYCEPLMACHDQSGQGESRSDTGTSDTGNSQSAGATNGNASTDDAGAGQSDHEGNRGHDSNTPFDFQFIGPDLCLNPHWETAVPCQRMNDQD